MRISGHNNSISRKLMMAQITFWRWAVVGWPVPGPYEPPDLCWLQFSASCWRSSAQLRSRVIVDDGWKERETRRIGLSILTSRSAVHVWEVMVALHQWIKTIDLHLLPDQHKSVARVFRCPNANSWRSISLPVFFVANNTDSTPPGAFLLAPCTAKLSPTNQPDGSKCQSREPDRS